MKIEVDFNTYILSRSRFNARMIFVLYTCDICMACLNYCVELVCDNITSIAIVRCMSFLRCKVFISDMMSYDTSLAV